MLTEKKFLNETKNHNPKGGGAFQVKWSVPNLSFEKTQNMIMKQILGVHGKTPNLAIHATLGLEQLCFKAFKLMLKY